MDSHSVHFMLLLRDLLTKAALSISLSAIKDTHVLSMKNLFHTQDPQQCTDI